VIVAMGLLAAVGLTGCDGDDGGGGGGGDTVPSGVCNACDSITDCAAGLECQACEQDCTSDVMRCVGFSGAGALSCENGVFPASCVNIAGSWDIFESASGQCTAVGETEPFDMSTSATVIFEQSGCAVQYTIPGQPFARIGTVVGNRMKLTGPFLVATQSGVSFSENAVSIEGTVTGDTMDLSGTALGAGTINGQPFSCTGMSTASASR